MTKYKIWDNQLNKYAFDESIFESFEDAIEQLISFFSADHSEEDLKQLKPMLIAGEDYADLSIEELEEDNLMRCVECNKKFNCETDIWLCEECMALFDLNWLWRLHDEDKVDALDFNEDKFFRNRFRL